MTQTTTKRTVADMIDHLGPCEESREWAAGYTSPSRAWRECQRGDWMLWLLGRLAGPPESCKRRKLVACAADCAALVLPIYERIHPRRVRVRKCIEACRAWSRGECTIEELREAERAVRLASPAAACAARIACPSRSNGAVASAASQVADYAAIYCAYNMAAGRLDWESARDQILAQCADIVRTHYAKPPKVRAPK